MTRPGMTRAGAGKAWRCLTGWWRSSLQSRVIALTLVLTVAVALLSGFLINNRISSGIMQAKRQSSITEAATSLQRMQRQLNETDLRTESLFERLGQLAVEAGSEAGQHGVIIEAAASVYSSKSMTIASVPANLRHDVEAGSSGLWITPTTVRYTDAADEPGLAVGGNLQAPDGELFPVYFVFPLSHEREQLDLVRSALLSTGALLLAALTLVAWLIGRQVTKPVKEARTVAQRIADGRLDERLPVRGSDEFADLASSMNQMASTLQSQIVRLEALSQVQRRFVSDVSHELRTPLTTLRMGVDVLYEGRDDFEASQRRTTELLYDELDRFETLLADLLQISRFDAGAETLTLDDVDLNELVAHEIAGVQGLAERYATPIELHREGDVVVLGESRRLARIVRNLLTNAIEHGEAHPIEVNLVGDEDAVALSVRDHGVGFEPDVAQKVFERFWRADPSRNRMVGGTGLGLAISLEDAHLHNGWLEAWGRPGEGAQFRLTLPRDPQVALTQSPVPLEPSDVGPGQSAELPALERGSGAIETKGDDADE